MAILPATATEPMCPGFRDSPESIDDLRHSPYNLPMAACVMECDTLSLVFPRDLGVRGCQCCRSCRSATDMFCESPALIAVGSVDREPVRRWECESRSDIAYETWRAWYTNRDFILAILALTWLASSAPSRLTVHRPLSTRPGLHSGLLEQPDAYTPSLLGTRSLP